MTPLTLYQDQYPVCQFERMPDEHLLDDTDLGTRAFIDGGEVRELPLPKSSDDETPF